MLIVLGYIISLIKIAMPELLSSVYGDVILPEAVFNELVSNSLMSVGNKN